MMTLGLMTSESICVYEYGSSVKSTNDRCFESHLQGLLEYNPKDRLTANAALNTLWFAAKDD